MFPFAPSYKRTMPSTTEPSLVVMIKSPVPLVAIVASELLSPSLIESALTCKSPVPSGAIVTGELEALGDLILEANSTSPLNEPVPVTIEVGVMLPSERAIVPLVVIGEPETPTPLEPDTETEVTVPEPTESGTQAVLVPVLDKM